MVYHDFECDTFFPEMDDSFQCTYSSGIIEDNNIQIEFITYEKSSFPRFCTLPGMWERTLNVSSAAKTFSVTGWKIGWVYGPENLVNAVSRCSQFIWFSVSTPMQEAIAVSFEAALGGDYFNELKASYTRKRDHLMSTLEQSGLNPILPQGSFFILTNIQNFALSPGKGAEPESTLTNLFLDSKDWNFCRWLTVEVGVTAIPCSAFYSGDKKPVNTVRFAFCKTDEELEKARERLLLLKDKLERQ